MVEAEAYLWVESMRECLKASKAEMSPHVYSMFSELLRFHEEFCCPERTRIANEKLRWTCPDCGSMGYPSTHVCGDGS